MPNSDSENTPGTALVIVPHPDDADFMSAGTVALWAREGWQVILVVITDGSKGTEDPDMTPERIIRIRKEEQNRAAAHLGIQDIVFLGYEDGLLDDSHHLREDLTRLIRTHRPGRVICMDPTMRYGGDRYVNHPDHVASGNAVLAAVSLLARNRPSFRYLLADGLEPHKVAELYVSGTDQPNCWIDITATIDQKIKALCEHKSQISPEKIEEMVRDWAKRDAEGRGMEYAESYRLMKLA
jgi:LmbE family N-acetylglucosaminyl deacetylase